MTDCWQSEELVEKRANYCTQCGAPQTPAMAANAFFEHASEFKRGIDGLLDLVDGCPEMLAEGLTDWDADSELSTAEWQDRFANPIKWLRAYFYRLWLDYYDISNDELKEFLDEHEEVLNSSENEHAPDFDPANDMCPCGATLPSDPPGITTHWQDATQSTAVCFDCFGEISTRLAGTE